MTPKTAILAALLTLAAGAASAEINTDAVIADYQAQGFTRIEIRNGLTQTRVEAIRGTEKIEVVLDNATGTILKSETDTIGALENTAPGVSIRDRNRDFVRVSTAGGDASDDSEHGSHVSGADDGPNHDVGDDNGDDGHSTGDDGNNDHASGSDDGADHDSADHESGDHESGGSDGADHGGGDHGGGSGEAGDD